MSTISLKSLWFTIRPEARAHSKLVWSCHGQCWSFSYSDCRFPVHTRRRPGCPQNSWVNNLTQRSDLSVAELKGRWAAQNWNKKLSTELIHRSGRLQARQQLLAVWCDERQRTNPVNILYWPLAPMSPAATVGHAHHFGSQNARPNCSKCALNAHYTV